MATNFEPDPKIAEAASAYSLDALDLATENFGITLDWSDESIRRVEDMLGQLHVGVPLAKPPKDLDWTFAKAFGSYVGEVLRRNHGGEWGVVQLEGQTFPGVQQPGGRLCWPWGRAYNRIVDGPENNMWHYYQLLIEPPAE